MSDAPINRLAARRAGAAPHAWLDALDRADADVAAGRVHEIDVDALCREIEAEAAALEAGQPQPHAPSAA